MFQPASSDHQLCAASVLSQLAPPKLAPHLLSIGASPELGRAVTHVTLGHTHPATPPSDLSPEYVQGTCQLTPRGKTEVSRQFYTSLECSASYHKEYMYVHVALLLTLYTQ